MIGYSGSDPAGISTRTTPDEGLAGSHIPIAVIGVISVIFFIVKALYIFVPDGVGRSGYI